MNTIDAIALFVMLLFTVRGLYKGLINELFSLLAIVLGIAFVYFFGTDVNNWVQEKVSINHYLINVLFIVQFILIALAVKYIGKSITAASKLLALGTINRLLGGLFGLVKSILVLSLACYVLLQIHKTNPDLVKLDFQESYTINIFNEVYLLL
jgi:membrane protein required for colicin V production